MGDTFKSWYDKGIQDLDLKTSKYQLKYIGNAQLDAFYCPTLDIQTLTYLVSYCDCGDVIDSFYFMYINGPR